MYHILTHQVNDLPDTLMQGFSLIAMDIAAPDMQTRPDGGLKILSVEHRLDQALSRCTTPVRCTGGRDTALDHVE